MNRTAFVMVVSIVSMVTLALAANVPNPMVTGPIPATAKPGDPSHDYLFFSTTVDLAAYGYVEEEFFLEGTANRYNTPALATGSVIDGGHPYRTRMVVRRPAAKANFDGTVVLEWQNVTANYDLDGFWVVSYLHYIRRGSAWIGVSAQRAGVHDPSTGLKAWSPRRYGTLDVTENGAILDDALSFDIYSQAAQAVRNPKGVDPLGGLAAKRILAGGASQSAARLVTYYNSIHPLAGVFDGYLIIIGGAQLRTDLPVKAIKIASESDVATGNRVANRQPDHDYLRSWEVAGSAHLDYYMAQQLAPLQLRDFGVPRPENCDLPAGSRIPIRFVFDAAHDHMVRWVDRNIPPPAAPEIELVSVGPPVAIARDRFGNALGGIQLPQHAVPTATNSGFNSGPGFCRLYGTFNAFDAATLKTLYPDAQTYLLKVIQATADNLKAEYIVPEDAVQTIWDAAYFDLNPQP